MEINLSAYYQAPDKTLWQGRLDSATHERFFQIVECVDLHKTALPMIQQQQFAIVGFKCDVGIIRNLGRPGAKDGPSALRRQFAKLASSNASETKIIDVGDIVCDDENLEAAQEALGEIVAYLLQHNYQPLVLGGGHETAWGHYQGIAKAYPRSSLGIINFDAHLDLRPLLAANKGSSGTPFLQIAMKRIENQQNFSYLCLGVQAAANTATLFNTAKKLNVRMIPAADLIARPVSAFHAVLDKFLAQHTGIYVSLCLDVFANAVAPGVSAPQALGLYPQHVIPLLQYLIASKKIISFDIVELSPPLDVKEMTSRLAAALTAEYIYASCG